MERIVTAWGREAIDLFMDKRDGGLQGLEAGAKLLCKFLRDMDANQKCQFEEIGGHSLDLLAIDGNEVHRQTIDKIKPHNINLGLKSPVEFPKLSLSRRTPKDHVLAIVDPEGDLLCGDEKLSNLRMPVEKKYSFLFYQTRCLKNVFKGEGTKPPLMEHLKNGVFKRFVIVIDVAVLRDTGANISRRLSWEKAAADTVGFNPNHILNSEETIQAEIYWVVRFDYGGVIVMQTHLSHDQPNYLYFVPESAEQDIIKKHTVHSTALEVAFLSGLISGIIPNDPKQPLQWMLPIKKGLRAARYVAYKTEIEDGALRYPTLSIKDLDGKTSHETDTPMAMFSGDEIEIKFYSTELESTESENKSVRGEVNIDLNEHPIPRTDLEKWCILATSNIKKNGEPIRKDKDEMLLLGMKIVRDGVANALSGFPIAKFDDLVSADKWEIENFYRISNRVDDYLRETEEKKPLSIAVFGEPGSGKSYMIRQIIKGITQKIAGSLEKSKKEYPVSDWNLSQFLDYNSLLVAFQKVRDATVEGLTPIVFFDEFDTSLNGELGWLKFFLGPLQDGVFFDNGFQRPIGRAIFIFIGGTARTFEEFKSKRIQIPSEATSNTLVALPILTPVSSTPGSSPAGFKWVWNNLWEVEQYRAEKAHKAAKKLDFASRLGLSLDIPGYNKPSDDDLLYIVRRAILIRSKLEKEAKDSHRKTCTADLHVLRGLLDVCSYQHGARSIGAVINGVKGRLNRSALPENLGGYLDLENFNACTGLMSDNKASPASTPSVNSRPES